MSHLNRPAMWLLLPGIALAGCEGCDETGGLGKDDEPGLAGGGEDGGLGTDGGRTDGGPDAGPGFDAGGFDLPPGVIRAVVRVTPPTIRRGDAHETLVTLDGRASVGEGLTYTWTIPDARLEGGDTLEQPLVRVRLPGSADHPFSLTVRNEDGMDVASGVVELDDPPFSLVDGGAVVTVGQAVTLDGSRSYDPEGGELDYLWEVAERPAGSTPTLSGSDTATAEFVPDAPGRYRVELTVHDGLSPGLPAHAWVVAEPADLDPPEVTVTLQPTVVAVGEPVQVCVVAVDDSGLALLEARVGDEGVALGEDGCGVHTPAAAGRLHVSATATDEAGNRGAAAGALWVHDGADDGPPTVALTAPEADTTLEVPQDAVGTARDGDLAAWFVEAAAAGSDHFVPFLTGDAPVEDAVLGSIDPGGFVQGDYRVRLCAEDTWGHRVCTAAVPVEMAGPPVPGFLGLGFLDVRSEVVGVPMRVARIYDSRDKVARDFGVGWRMEAAWDTGFSGPDDPAEGWFLRGFDCVIGSRQTIESADHVYVVRVGDDFWAFAMGLKLAGPAPPGTQSCRVHVRFREVARSGPRATFELAAGVPTEDLYLPLDGRGPVCIPGDFGIPGPKWEPAGFALRPTTGVAYELDASGSLLAATDARQRRYAFSRDGVAQGDGTAVIRIVRGEDGFVDRIETADGGVRTYTNNRAGDLVAYTDPASVTVRYAYDTAHNLTRITDGRGFSAGRMIFDERGRLVGFVDELGEVRTLTEYDDEANVVRMTDELGNTTTFEYRDDGLPARVTDALGGVRSFEYDDNGFPSQVVEPDGSTTSFDYAETGRLRSRTDPAGNRWEYAWTEGGVLRELRDPLGRVVLSRTVDEDGRVVSEADARGGVTQYGYDDRGLLSQVVGAEGTQVTMDRDDAGNVSAYHLGDGTTHQVEVGPDGLVRRDGYVFGGEEVAYEYEHDAAGNVTHVTTPTGMEAQLHYDAAGQVVGVDNGLGRRTEHVREGDLLRAVVLPTGVLSLDYDAAGAPIRLSLPNGLEIRRDLDPLGRVRGVTGPGLPDTTAEYGAGPTPTVVSSPLGPLEVRSEHLPDGRQVQELVHQATGAVVERRELDQAGQLVGFVDVAGVRQELAYDAAGNRTELRYADGSTETVELDLEDRPVRSVDAAGRVTELTYDAVGRVATSARGEELATFGYNEIGALSSVTLAGGAGVEYETDAEGSLTLTRRPWGGEERIERDAQGRPVLLVDGAGNEVVQEYAPETGLLVRRGPWRFEYAPSGRLARATGPDGPIALFHGPGGHLARVDDGRGSAAFTTDQAGRRTSLTTAGRRVTYEYGEQLLEAIDLGGDGRVEIEYDASFRPATVRYPNGVVATLEYGHPRGWLTAWRLAGPELQWEETYEYDGSGRPTRVVRGGVATGYEYDGAGRLVSETTDGVTTAYAYGGNGDLLQAGDTTYAVEDTQVLSAGDTTYAWDAAGRLAERTEGAAVERFVYDELGQLVRVDREGAGSVELSYDDRGWLTRVAAGGVGRNLRWDRGSEIPVLLAETDDEGGLIAHYVHDGLGGVVRRGPDGTMTVLHRDGLGSIGPVSAGDGGLAGRLSFSAFGPATAAGPEDVRLRYAGAYWVEELSLYAMGTRFFDPRTGRFSTPDPEPPRLEDPMSVNAYQYALNAPTAFADPTGGAEFTLPNLVVSLAINAALCAIVSLVIQPIIEYVAGRFVGKFPDWGWVGLALRAGVDISFKKAKHWAARLFGVNVSLLLTGTIQGGTTPNSTGLRAILWLVAGAGIRVGSMSKPGISFGMGFAFIFADPTADVITKPPKIKMRLRFRGNLGKVMTRYMNRTSVVSSAGPKDVVRRVILLQKLALVVFLDGSGFAIGASTSPHSSKAEWGRLINFRGSREFLNLTPNQFRPPAPGGRGAAVDLEVAIPICHAAGGPNQPRYFGCLFWDNRP